jgi:uncharacterized protein YjbI with pentapeptide repeats
MSKSDELAQIIAQHRRWLASAKQNGKRADLSGANLNGINLSGADLSGALMQGASLKKANLSDVQLIHTDLRDANLRDANLARANLLLADFTGADLKKADLSAVTSSSDKVLGEMRRGPRFKDADLQQANLSQAYCYLSDFSGANLSGAVLAGATLERANLSHNDLSGIDLLGANLSNANLHGSNLSGADLGDADLEHADLQFAKLSDADVSGASLRSANLADAQVEGIQYDRGTLFRGIRVSSCYGSSRFRRFAQDQDFIEEFKQSHLYAYYVWLILTDCGRSMARAVLWSVALAFAFGLVFYALGEDAFDVTHKQTLGWGLFTSMYYSVVTFTTLGFGDITPRTPLAATIVMVEVVVGYFMLGILISILATKVARRS